MRLQDDFNEQQFSKWVEEFLPDFSYDLRNVDSPTSSDSIITIKTLGESPIGVRVFIIETERDPSNKKVGLAKESFSLLKNYATSNALIAYYSSQSDRWRLSLLTSTPEWSDGKVITKLSNPKRQSYVLGEQAKINTPNRFLIKRGPVEDLVDLKDRFSLEVVNKEFYKAISESFTKLVGGTVGAGKSKKEYKALLKLPSTADQSQASLEFAVRLIGRIIFCWFLREKKSEDGTALMPVELLSHDAISEYDDYYHKILEPIFFEVLNQPLELRKEEFTDNQFSQIPYLNGGLFSPHEDDFYKRRNRDLQSQFHNTLIIPDEWLADLFETLETYNFTIDENTSFDEELSIDPEMLGRIFENLLAEINPETGESARKSTGSYYTPRVIVDYMVDESLFLYLKQQTGIEEDKLRAVISYDLTDDLEFSLEQSEKEKVINALEKIKILDPACGSGAFPIGALQKTVFILQQVDPNGQLWFNRQMKNVDVEFKRDIQRRYENKEYNYIRKLGLIRESIYGIDIQPIATEISRLRCFLTLIVDQTVNSSENRGIKPLPNLEFKFVTANSLIGLPTLDDPQTSLFDDTSLISELKDIRDQFFNSSGIEREQLKHEFAEKQNDLINDLIKRHSYTGVTKAELTSKLTSWKPFKHQATDWFDPEWMFGIKDGFDIVLANPPYLRVDDINKDEKIEYKKLYTCSTGKYDLYYLFFEKALDLINSNGIVTFISPNKYCAADSATRLREILLSNPVSLLEILSTSNLDVFSDASNYPIISILGKNESRKVTVRQALNIDKLRENNSHKSYTCSVSKLKKFPYTVIPINTKQEAVNLLLKLSTNSSNLSHLLSISEGLRIPAKFQIEEQQELKIVKQYQFSKYSTIEDGSYISQENLEKVITNSSTRYKNIFKDKILIAEDALEINATLDLAHHIPQGGVYFATLKDNKYDINYLLGLLNSSLFSYLYEVLFAGMHMGGGYLRYRSKFLEGLPIPSSVLEKDLSSEIIGCVKEILDHSNKNVNTTNKENLNHTKTLRDRINKSVFELYQLSAREINLIQDKYN